MNFNGCVAMVNLSFVVIGAGILGIIPVYDFQSLHPIFDDVTGTIFVIGGALGLLILMKNV